MKSIYEYSWTLYKLVSISYYFYHSLFGLSIGLGSDSLSILISYF